MNRIYQFLLKSEYAPKNYWGEKSFSFKIVNGDWSKIIYISKYGKGYKVEIMEGLSNIIKVTKTDVKTYKDVIELLK